jgi:hypothetical protein
VEIQYPRAGKFALSAKWRYSMTIIMQNQNKQIKESGIGFSWTVLFFGMFVPLLRKDWSSFSIYAGIMLMSLAFPPIAFVTIIAPFVYNKYYLKRLLNEGYYPTTVEQARILVSFGVATVEQMRVYRDGVNVI